MPFERNGKCPFEGGHWPQKWTDADVKYLTEKKISSLGESPVNVRSLTLFSFLEILVSSF
jgi:hypothetical protein